MEYLGSPDDLVVSIAVELCGPACEWQCTGKVHPLHCQQNVKFPTVTVQYVTAVSSACNYTVVF